ncbi:copper homeostasis protein CutC [Roseateles cellulosilyticus]|uniref:PF03932 family protein CutC n=1 Tax=Pelomonas cellulosilytica TaxID=2906762 RepID=A0ABS8XXA5_9BURK|nr:copper homeostasis protein CutC [Pelomonas sp. P8]MCE4553920.1 copper homeostasis protein CutC [Pelomonas sp. P8]
MNDCSAVLLEVIVLDAQDAAAAAAAGADRLELVSDMAQGGLTPAAEIVQAVVRACSIPVMVMARPHARSFVYDEADMAQVREAIAVARDAGAAGIVFGALTDEGDIHTERLEQVLHWADGLPVTFHRAFDACRDPWQAFDVLGAYRGPVAQLLTSGAAPTADDGAALLRRMVACSRRGEGVEPLVGSGVTVANLPTLHAVIGARQYHVGSAARIGGRFDAGIDAARIAALRSAL